LGGTLNQSLPDPLQTVPTLEVKSMSPRIRRWTLALIGLLAWPASADVILHGDSGRPATRAEVLADLAAADFILLGETHDNPRHHQARAELLRDLPPGVKTVVLEQLERGKRLDPALPLDDALERAGFDRKAWGWPLHQPVFVAARDLGASLLGGNLGRKDGRRVAREGESALDADQARLLEHSPLSDTARGLLDESLNTGHCGHLPAARLPNMRLAQRARDAALARTLLESRDGPVVLLAGNGHVRRDFGVPVLLAGQAPGARVVSIGFMEIAPGERPEPGHMGDAYDFLWFTAPAEREDPCAGFSMP
jgi:uncharacterized iron-regulated protein